MRINIRQVKALIWVLCLVALGAAGWAFWTVYENTKVKRVYDPWEAGKYSQLLKSQIEGGREPIIIGYDEGRQEAIWNAIVDGTLRPEPEDPGERAAREQQVEVKKVVKPIDQVLEVGLIVHSGDRLARQAAVAYLPTANITSQAKATRMYLTEGSMLDAPYDADPYFGEVVEIGPQQVVFSWGGENVPVTPKLGVEGTSTPLTDYTIPAAEDPRAELEEWPEETVVRTSASGKRQALIGSTSVDRIRTDPQKHLLDDVRTRPFIPAGGGQTQLELTAVEEGSVAAEVGFESGDQIISVNGVPMSSIASAINWYNANPNEPSYTIVFQRFGKIDSITIYPPAS